MQRVLKTDRMEWFIPLRLASFVIIFAVLVLWLRNPDYLRLPFFLYCVFTLAFTLLLALDKKRRVTTLGAAVIALQFISELTVEVGIIYATGATNSPFSALCLLTIVSAAMIFRLTGTLLIASLLSLLYAGVVWLGLPEVENPGLNVGALRVFFEAQDTVFYSLFLHILMFYLTAFIAGFLAERLIAQDRQLADTSRELRRARLETDDILYHLNSGLLTVDAQGTIVFFNRAAEKILEYREEEIKGRLCTDVFGERMPNLAQCLMESIDLREAHVRREITISSSRGTEIPVGLSISILTEPDLSVRGVIAIFSDLREAKMLEAKMRAADRLAAVGELSASIAHEIHNPLAAISGSVEMLKNDLVLSGENRRLMELILKESQRLNKILSEFLQYARVDRPAYTKVDLCHTISDVLRLLHHHDSFGDNIAISFETRLPVVYVTGDEDLLKQLLLNLMVNACEAFEGRPGRIAVEVRTDEQKGQAWLQIEDNGPGIPEDVQRKIYQPFFSTKKSGTGLGLAIVHRICSTLKLRMRVRSEIGRGTCFTIEFNSYQPDRITFTPVLSTS